MAIKSNLKVHAFVSRGPKKGTILLPHRHEDGAYVVSMTRFERDYERVTNPDELLGWLEKGFRLRMSNTDAGVAAPSLIAATAIYRPVQF